MSTFPLFPAYASRWMLNERMCDIIQNLVTSMAILYLTPFLDKFALHIIQRKPQKSKRKFVFEGLFVRTAFLTVLACQYVCCACIIYDMSRYEQNDLAESCFHFATAHRELWNWYSYVSTTPWRGYTLITWKERI